MCDQNEPSGIVASSKEQQKAVSSLLILHKNPSVVRYSFPTQNGTPVQVIEVMVEPDFVFQFPQMIVKLLLDDERSRMRNLMYLGSSNSLSGEMVRRKEELMALHSGIVLDYEMCLRAMEDETLRGRYFRKSTEKEVSQLEFVPINLHMQRMWCKNEMGKERSYDFTTVGAFTSNARGFKGIGMDKRGRNKNRESEPSEERLSKVNCLVVEICFNCRALHRLLKFLLLFIGKKNSSLIRETVEHIGNRIGAVSGVSSSELVGNRDYFFQTVEDCAISSKLNSSEVEEIYNGQISEMFNATTDLLTYHREEMLKEDCFRRIYMSLVRNTFCGYFSGRTSSGFEFMPLDMVQLNITASFMRLKQITDQLCSSIESGGEEVEDHCEKEVEEVEKGAATREDASVPVERENHLHLEEKNSAIHAGMDLASIVEVLRPCLRKLFSSLDNLAQSFNFVYLLNQLNVSSAVLKRHFEFTSRRDVCFSQALTSVASSLLSRLWCREVDEGFIHSLTTCGPLIQLEGLITCYNGDEGRLSDFWLAIQDLKTVDFFLVPEDYSEGEDGGNMPIVDGVRGCIRVMIPAPEIVLRKISMKRWINGFRVTPILFNIGINEEASLASSLGLDRPQYAMNESSFVELERYCQKLSSSRSTLHLGDSSSEKPGVDIVALGVSVEKLRKVLDEKVAKDGRVLELAAGICRAVDGIRFVSCKSAKDRTGMGVTLEQTRLLEADFGISKEIFQQVLDEFRLKGTRRINCDKNTGKPLYSFSALQLKLFSDEYKPPAGTFGGKIT